MLEQAKANDTFAARVQMANGFGVIKGQLMTAASKASSAREYSMLAQQNLQGTSSRYLNELGAVQSPPDPTLLILILLLPTRLRILLPV